MEATRAKILKAALELFSKYGYNATTTRELARKAEVTEVTLFRYFSSKEDLFKEVVCVYLPSPDFKEIVSQAKEMWYSESLKFIASAFLEGLKQNESLIRIMYMQAQSHYELMEKIYAALVNNLVNILAEYFEEMQQKNLIRKFNPIVGANAFLGMWMALYETNELLPATMNFTDKLDETLDEYIDIFVIGTQR